MNIHPIFVHFPIGLLTLYAFFEVFRLVILTRQNWYFFIKANLAIFGFLGSIATFITGQMSEEFMKGHPALEVHERFAFLSVFTFGIIALLYAMAWYEKVKIEKGIVLEHSVIKFSHKIVFGKIIIVLAILGFMFLTITGGIGGAMVYGENADPLFTPIYKLLVK